MLLQILRRGGTALAAVLLAAGPVVAPASASAAPAAACTGDDGVTVIVDFGSLGGGVQIRCVTAAVTSGFDALTKAGFSYATTQRFPGLLCRIDGKPTPADAPCVNAPPADRYWGYWTAAGPGGSWTYSDLGAGNRTPPPGSVEGWAFADGCDRKPGSGPCPSAGTTTTRPPATTTTRAPSGGAPPTTAGPGGSTPLGPDDQSTTTTAVEGGSGATTSTRARDHAPEAGEEGDDELGAAGVATSTRAGDGDDGSPVGLLVGIGAVVALVGAGTVTAHRRRATDEGTG